MATAPKLNKDVETTTFDKLKAQAQIMGVDFRDDITEKGLRKQLMDALEQAQEGDVLTNAQRTELERDSTRLIRCIITPMASHMKDHQGQLFSVGNSVLGYISKYILFNAEYHVPKIILDHIKTVETQYFVTKVINGEQVKESKMRPAFGVQELPNLTAEELADLAKSQMARSAITG